MTDTKQGLVVTSAKTVLDTVVGSGSGNSSELS